MSSRPRPTPPSAPTPASGGAPHRLTGDERRHQILEAAADLFSRRGYHGTKIRDITSACGVTEAVLYRYFDGKEALFTAALQSRIDAHDIDALLREIPRGAPLAEIFQAIAMHILRIGRDDPTVHRLLLSASLAESPGTRGAYVTWRLPFVTFLEDLIRSGISRGEIRSVNPTLSARAFVGLVMDCVLSCRLWSELGYGDPDPQVLVQNNVPTFVRGLLAQPGDTS